MNKGVINLYRYREVALAANRRYLEALSVVDDSGAGVSSGRGTDRAGGGIRPESCRASTRPAARTCKLFQAVLDGDNVLRGFRNADIREALYGTTEDAAERRRQSEAVGRMLKRLHVRGLIVKVPRSHRWHVSPKGHQVLQGVLQLYHRGIPAALGTAA